jgi:hypothetical protein
MRPTQGFVSRFRFTFRAAAVAALALSSMGCKKDCDWKDRVDADLSSLDAQLSQVGRALGSPGEAAEIRKFCAALHAARARHAANVSWLADLPAAWATPHQRPEDQPSTEGACLNTAPYTSLQKAGACGAILLGNAVEELSAACESYPRDRRAFMTATQAAYFRLTGFRIRTEQIRKAAQDTCKCVTSSPEFPEGCSFHVYDPTDPAQRPRFYSSRRDKGSDLPEGGCGFFGHAGPAQSQSPAHTEATRSAN